MLDFQNLKHNQEIKLKSPHERRRYIFLKARQRVGLITDLFYEPELPIFVEGREFTKLKPDFLYFTRDGKVVIEEVKGKVIDEFFWFRWRLLKTAYRDRVDIFRVVFNGRIIIEEERTR